MRLAVASLLAFFALAAATPLDDVSTDLFLSDIYHVGKNDLFR